MLKHTFIKKLNLIFNQLEKYDRSSDSVVKHISHIGRCTSDFYSLASDDLLSDGTFKWIDFIVHLGSKTVFILNVLDTYENGDTNLENSDAKIEIGRTFFYKDIKNLEVIDNKIIRITFISDRENKTIETKDMMVNF